MSVGQSSTESGSFTNGDTWTYSYSVTAVENVSTGLGLYEAYRIESRTEIDYVNGNMLVATGTSWYVPGIGAVKMTVSEELSSAGVQQSLLTYMATLTGTSINY